MPLILTILQECSPLQWRKIRKTTRWPLQVFCFLLAMTEVNCRLILTNIYIYIYILMWVNKTFRRNYQEKSCTTSISIYPSLLKCGSPRGWASLSIVWYHSPRIGPSRKLQCCTAKLRTSSLFALIVDLVKSGHTVPVSQEK